MRRRLAALLMPRALMVVALVAGGPALAFDPPAPTTADLAQARSMIKARDYQGALRALREFEGRLDHADLYNLLGFASRKTGDYARAEVYYVKALRLDPRHLGALEYQGQLFAETGRLDQARRNLGTLTALCPKGCEELDDLRDAIKAKGG